MEPKEIDIELPRGNTCPITFTIVDENKQPLAPQSGDEIVFVIKKDFKDTSAIKTKKYSQGDITYSDGQFTFIIKPTDTDKMDIKKYVYTLTVTSGEYKTTLCLGLLSITKS